jgi:hypothetical protein
MNPFKRSHGRPTSPGTSKVVELKLTLLQNGLDFVREGVEALYGSHGSAPAHAHKYALLHVFSGTLLLLKERLRRAHPSLILKDVGQQATPDAKTVDFDEVLRRLQGAAGVALDRPDLELLRRVQKERNALEHFEANLQLDHVNALVGELVEFLDRFLRTELQESLFAHVSDAAGREIAELAKIAERLHQERIAEWRTRATPYFNLSDDELSQLADSREYHPKEDPGRGLLECPECAEDSVAIVDRGVGVCSNLECREVFAMSGCARCSAPSFSIDGDLCADCRAYAQEQMERD